MWFLIALIPTILWTLVGFIDKAVISKLFQGKGESVVLTTSFAGLLLSLFILVLHPAGIFVVPNFLRLIAIINGFIFVLAFMPYCKALEIEDASRAILVYQTVPIFGFILGALFLNEHFTLPILIGGFLILLGSLIVMIDSVGGKLKLKKQALILMLISAFMTALYPFIFKIVSLQDSFWSTGFWVYVGMFLCGIILFLIPKYRNDFLEGSKGNLWLVLGLGTLTEVMSIIGVSIIAYVALKIPLAIVQTINGFQPFIIIIIGYLLTKLLPKFFNESFSKKHAMIKITAFLIMFAGVLIINFW